MTTTIEGALLALSAPPTTIAGAFGAVCSRCNSGYKTTKWEAPWLCPECAEGGLKIVGKMCWPPPLAPLVTDDWGAGS